MINNYGANHCCVFGQVLPVQWTDHNWQSLQEVLRDITMCCFSKSISGSKAKTIG